MIKNRQVPNPEAEVQGMYDAHGLNFFETDPNVAFLLRYYVSEDEYEKVHPLLKDLGEVAGNQVDELAHDADRNPPELVSYNKKGEQINHVKYHPSYLRLEEIGYGQFGLAAMSHRAGVLDWPTPFSRVLKYSFWYLFAQAEFSLCCPMSMTDSAATILEKYASGDIKEKYLPRLTSTNMDEHWTAGQFMTEKQGGSDVGANTVTAKQVGDHWEIWGDKWFCSNVSADIALVLARPEGARQGSKGLAMFLVPKRLENGEHNEFRINRLKNKFGTKDMASGEVTFEGAVGYVVGNIENGFKQMMSMVNSSRLSNAVRSAALMRRSYLESIVASRGRHAFGKQLSQLPLMREGLFEMLLDTEAAASMIFYTAKVFDQSDNGDENAKKSLRILTPLLKGYICKRARYVTAEAMEIRGGNGYIEDWVNPRLVRDAHLGSIWEGTTNIVSLDVLRAIRKEDAGSTLLHHLEQRLSGMDNAYTGRTAKLILERAGVISRQMEHISQEQASTHDVAAKRFMEQMYHLVAASLLLEEAEHEITVDGNYRKLFLLLHYYHRYIKAADNPILFDQSVDEWLDTVIDWEEIPEDVVDVLLEPLEGGDDRS
ncbi:acyl-CoA dehydrogenase family protein [Salicibibacter cibi]|uniref:Acyl-CoA dehydrogenase family protein n=1 Tax=Salicibibacter cibi TaxID=2743001 RepID=A0A7T6ZBL3_9BACI|nr:acyl-CoA dehydrogenase family protein [Salicibibacter cibi]QQK80337.1 acyl-CoA dehydrogenase family protein [Salicibibacter cibi]